MARWWTAALVLVASGCLKERRGGEDPFPAALVLADHAWAARGREGLAAAFARLEDAERLRPTDSEVRWRRARLEIASGLAEDGMPTRRAALARARDVGLACTFANPGAQHAWRRGEFEEAVRLIASPDLVCQGWAALAWTRLVIDQGADAAGLDRERLNALVTGLRGAESTPQRWARALVLTLNADPADLAIARADLLALLSEADEPAWVHADLALRVADPLGDQTLREEQVERLRAMPIDTPEGRRARRLVLGERE